MESEKHPLESGLPEWLAAVPMEAAASTPIVITEGKAVSAKMLAEALGVEVGTAIGAMSIDPKLAQIFSEFTENPAWKNLAPEPTLVKRTDVDEWEITIGDYSEVLSRADIKAKLGEALGDA